MRKDVKRKNDKHMHECNDENELLQFHNKILQFKNN